MIHLYPELVGTETGSHKIHHIYSAGKWFVEKSGWS